MSESIDNHSDVFWINPGELQGLDDRLGPCASFPHLNLLIEYNLTGRPLPHEKHHLYQIAHATRELSHSQGTVDDALREVWIETADGWIDNSEGTVWRRHDPYR